MLVICVRLIIDFNKPQILSTLGDRRDFLTPI